MIWQENVKFIVMLTNIIENGKVSISTNYNVDLFNSSCHLNSLSVTIHNDLCPYLCIGLCIDNFLTAFLLIFIYLVIWNLNKTGTGDSIVDSGYRNPYFNLYQHMNLYIKILTFLSVWAMILSQVWRWCIY